MKVLIMGDNEGASGTNDFRMLSPTFPEQFADGCENQVQDINAAVKGARAAGAARIDVIDGHGGGGNIRPERLDPGANLLGGAMALLERAFGRTLGEYDALLLVGQHAQAGTPNGYLSHSNSGSVALRMNGKPVGEIGELAWLVGDQGVRTALVSGDAAACREAQAMLPGVRTAIVKTARDRQHVTLLSPEEAHQRIEAAAKDALQHLAEHRSYTLPGAVHVEVILARPEMAQAAMFMPRATLEPPATVAYAAQDYSEALRAFFAILTLGSQVESGEMLQDLQRIEQVRRYLAERAVGRFERFALEPSPFPEVRF